MKLDQTVVDAIEIPRASAALRRWQRALVCLWVALLVAAIYVQGRRIEIDRYVTSRLRYHAIPVAMSVLYHGRIHDYTGFRSLALGFQTPDPIDERLRWAVAYQPPSNDETHYWAADDRGMADYVIGAFALFGPHVTSLYTFYFVILGASVLLFLLDLGWSPAGSALLILALAAMYACLPVIPLGNLTVAVFEPGVLYEPRLLELLAFVATVHLGFAPFIDARWSWRRVGIVAAQAAILAACYHMRSSVGWEVAFVATTSAVAWATHAWPRAASRPPLPLVCVAAALVLFAGYRHHAYNPRYFDDMGGRTIWHNALMGLSSNAYLNAKYHVSLEDRAIVDDVASYLHDTHDARLTEEWNADKVLSSLGGYGAFNWFVYEDAARDFYWHIWRTDTRRALRCYLFDKPRDEVSVVLRSRRIDPTGARDRKGLYFRPLAPGNVILILPALVLAWTGRAAFGATLVAALAVLAWSTVPGLLFYPVVHAMIGLFAAIALVLYLALAAALGAIARMMHSHRTWSHA